MNYKQLGKFTISDYLISKYPDKVAAAFSKMQLIVVRAEYIWGQGKISYTALSPLFRNVPGGEIIPHYNITINDLNGEPTVSVEEIE